MGTGNYEEGKEGRSDRDCHARRGAANAVKTLRIHVCSHISAYIHTITGCTASIVHTVSAYTFCSCVSRAARADSKIRLIISLPLLSMTSASPKNYHVSNLITPLQSLSGQSNP